MLIGTSGKEESHIRNPLVPRKKLEPTENEESLFMGGVRESGF